MESLSTDAYEYFINYQDKIEQKIIKKSSDMIFIDNLVDKSKNDDGNQALSDITYFLNQYYLIKPKAKKVKSLINLLSNCLYNLLIIQPKVYENNGLVKGFGDMMNDKQTFQKLVKLHYTKFFKLEDSSMLGGCLWVYANCSIHIFYYLFKDYVEIFSNTTEKLIDEIEHNVKKELKVRKTICMNLYNEHV